MKYLGFLLSAIVSTFAFGQQVTFSTVDTQPPSSLGSFNAVFDPSEISELTIIVINQAGAIVSNVTYLNSPCNISNLSPGRYTFEMFSPDFSCTATGESSARGFFDIEGSVCDPFDYSWNVDDGPCGADQLESAQFTLLDLPLCMVAEFEYHWSTGLITRDPSVLIDDIEDSKVCVTLVPDATTCTECVAHFCYTSSSPPPDQFTLDPFISDICNFTEQVQNTNPKFGYVGSYYLNTITPGFVIVNPLGGTPPYNVLWDGAVQANFPRPFFSPGNYCVTVSDACGQIIRKCFDIEENETQQACLSPEFSGFDDFGTLPLAPFTDSEGAISYFSEIVSSPEFDEGSFTIEGQENINYFYDGKDNVILKKDYFGTGVYDGFIHFSREDISDKAIGSSSALKIQESLSSNSEFDDLYNDGAVFVQIFDELGRKINQTTFNSSSDFHQYRTGLRSTGVAIVYIRIPHVSKTFKFFTY